MILSCQTISKSYGTNVILDKVSFHIEEREKTALVGSNGTGKSTLLRIIANQLSMDEGQVTISKLKTLGFLEQHQDMTAGRTLYEELMEIKQPLIELESRIRDMETAMKKTSGAQLEELLASYTRMSEEFEAQNGYAYRSEVIGVIKGLGFTEDDFDKPAHTLSGGQKTRVALGKLLLLKPDILLLDEPTNHLDMDSIAWLETFLLRYDGAVIIVSHDRYFLDKVVSKVLSLEFGTLTTYMGNYSVFAEKQAMIRSARLKAYLNQQQELKHQEEVITKLRSFNREKSIKRAESREKLVGKILPLEKPQEAAAEMRITLEPAVTSGNDVLYADGLEKSFGSLTLFTDLSFSLQKGERVAIIGANGAGKTTILKLLNHVTKPDAGSIRTGTNVHIGYYDQEHQVLNPDKTIFEEISDAYPTLTGTRIRNVLAAFLFTGDDVFQKIETLSGGERGRVSLAKLMLSKANFLILDEPTNHLDIVSKEILEHALNGYTGTVLYVSHDRYFINQTATRILDLTNQTMINYIGNYDYYLEKKDALTLAYAGSEESPVSEVVNENKQSWQQQKEEQARERKRLHALKRLEKEIDALEARDKEIDGLLEKDAVARDMAQCVDLSAEKVTIGERLEQCYREWEELA